VVTSGFRSSGVESLFPRGIPIGRVTKVDLGEVELYQRVHIRPFADLRRIDFVQVLTSRGRTAQEQAGVPTP
jgi:rod shape-determining protein MreC